MSPIIELQRRLVEAGRIRAGDQVAYTNDKGETKYRANKLANWRLTSKDHQRLERAAELWGGEVRAWEGRDGEWELYTATGALPITLLPGQLPTTWYELWTKGGCQRRCDGVHEVISDSSCLCGDERECKPYTRLSVLLPDLPGIGSWLVTSTGWNAAAELAGAADLLQRASAQGVLIPARLRLEQRVSVSEGQTRRFAVPVIDIDVSFRDLLGAQGALSSPSERAALPSGYVPLTGNGEQGVSVEQGLAQAERSATVRNARSAAPIPEADDFEFGDSPVPVDDPGASPPPHASDDAAPAASQASSEPKPTKRQLEKLNVLVGTLREKLGVITTANLYAALANTRGVDVDVMIELTKDATDAEGVLHWAPLRDSLTRVEASDLIDRLQRLEDNQPKATA